MQTALEALEQQREFSLIKKLGAGAFGNVRLMEDRKNGRNYAVKIVRIGEIDDSEKVLWPKLNHPNVLFLLEFMILVEVGIFLTDVRSGSLFDKVRNDKKFRKNPQALKHIKGWFRDVLRGIEYLHSMDLCHLDIKSDNVLISQTSKAMICDFTFLKSCAKSIDR